MMQRVADSFPVIENICSESELKAAATALFMKLAVPF
jgi:hypothetical protein